MGQASSDDPLKQQIGEFHRAAIENFAVVCEDISDMVNEYKSLAQVRGGRVAHARVIVCVLYWLDCAAAVCALQ